MTILSIETSGTVFSALIWKDGKILSQFHIEEPMVASKMIAPEVRDLHTQSDLNYNEIDYVLYNCGPGSFTGLRVGLSFIKGLFHGSDTKIIGIPSFDILLHNNDENRIGMFESKRDEIYYFQDNEIVTLKKALFESTFKPKDKFISFYQPQPQQYFESFNFKIRPYSSELLVDVFLKQKENGSEFNSRSELIYVYE